MHEQVEAKIGSIESWAKTVVMILGFIIQGVILSFYVGTTVTGINAKIDAVNTATGVTNSSLIDLKTTTAQSFNDVRQEMRSAATKLQSDLSTSNGDLRRDIKELSAVGIEVGKNSMRLSSLEHQVEVLEERSSIVRSAPTTGRNR